MLVKALLTSTSFATGFDGGPIFPLLFIGGALGLAISKRMVEMQGGTISIVSVLGQGSTFLVVLPVHVDEVMEAA